MDDLYRIYLNDNVMAKKRLLPYTSDALLINHVEVKVNLVANLTSIKKENQALNA